MLSTAALYVDPSTITSITGYHGPVETLAFPLPPGLMYAAVEMKPTKEPRTRLINLPTTNTSIALTVSLLPPIIKKSPGFTG